MVRKTLERLCGNWCNLNLMNAILSPIVSEFETEEQATSYDRWFHAQVQASLDDPRPSTPHDQVMAEMDAIIAEAEKRRRPQA
jgi:hypothetical protein